MAKNKLQRFAELKTFPNVIELAEVKPGFKTKLNWSERFGNNNPITLELACGKGEYTLALARLFPKRNFIGIDIKGARLWCGAKTALEEKLPNVAFLRIQIENLEHYFRLPPLQRSGSGVVGHNLNSQNIPPVAKLSPIVTTIWIVFPDPFPRKRQINKRLSSPRFLAMYKKILAPGGAIHLKTDDLNLFNYSVETALAEGWKIKETINNIYALPKLNPLLAIKTFYENKHLREGKQIHYACFMNGSPRSKLTRNN